VLEVSLIGSNHVGDVLEAIAPGEFWETFYAPVIFILETVGWNAG